MRTFVLKTLFFVLLYHSNFGKLKLSADNKKYNLQYQSFFFPDNNDNY